MTPAEKIIYGDDDENNPDNHYGHEEEVRNERVAELGNYMHENAPDKTYENYEADFVYDLMRSSNGKVSFEKTMTALSIIKEETNEEKCCELLTEELKVPDTLSSAIMLQYRVFKESGASEWYNQQVADWFASEGTYADENTFNFH